MCYMCNEERTFEVKTFEIGLDLPEKVPIGKCWKNTYCAERINAKALSQERICSRYTKKARDPFSQQYKREREEHRF